MTPPRQPRVELVRFECRPVTLHRDEAGKPTGETVGAEAKVFSPEQFADYFAACQAEVEAANAALQPNRAARRAPKPKVGRG